MDDFGPAFIRDMKAGQTIVIPDVTQDPRTNAPAVRAAYASIRTRAILDTPLIRDGRMVSMIFVHHPQPRAWSATDAVLVEETCARVWTAVERVRADNRARVLLSLLDRAGAAARVGAFVDTLQGPRALRWSDRMFDILGVPPGPPPARDAAFDPFPSAVRSILSGAFAEMLVNGTALEIEVPLLPKPGAAEWVRLYVVPTMRDGRCIELSGAMQDISDRKRLELEVVEATNQERARIGADLHDDLGQVLTAVTLQVGAFKRSLDSTPPEEQRRHVQQIEGNLEHARTVCRRLARTYVAPVTSVSFLAMLRQLARDVPGDRQCQVHGAELPPSTPPVVAQELYRIAQEALTNALKHSECRRIDFEVRVDPDRLTLTVQDDGVGMPEDPATPPGVGLTSMRSRAARIGGVVTLAPAPGRGTRVSVVCARADGVAA
jgi:signal transduction histidine kinase